jgi:hypothetical protein
MIPTLITIYVGFGLFCIIVFTFIAITERLHKHDLDVTDVITP